METMMKRTLSILLLIGMAAALAAQQPQTQLAPISAINAKYVQGVGIGYWPTAGSGLTLHLAAGTANCGGTIVTDAAATLTMTASTTNYIYLNTSSSCVPAKKTTAFTSSDIPIATVVVGSSTITSIADDRTMFQESGSGGGSFPTLTVGAPVIANGSTAPVAAPGDLFPHLIDTGSGTEGSQWTNADNTAGIQTELTALEGGRNGRVSLPTGRYDIASPIVLAGQSDNLIGTSWGAPAEPNFVTEGVNGPKLRLDSSLTSGGTILQIGVVSGSNSDRTTGVVAENLYMFGSTTTLSSPLGNNAAVFVNGWNDTIHLRNIYINNFGVAFDLEGPSAEDDGGAFDHLYALGNGIGFLWEASSGGAWYNVLANSVATDNGYQGAYGTGVGQTEAGSSNAGESLTIENSTFVRNCYLSGCAAETGKAANIYWERSKGNIKGNDISAAGLDIYTSSWVAADGIDLVGSYNSVTGNHIHDQTQSGTCGVRITGNHDYLAANRFDGNVTDICVASGATDNVINQPGAVVTDAGTRTVINGVSTNAGDPNSAGNWNGVTKWAGLVIDDTTDSVEWLYLTPTSRLSLGGSVGITLTTIGTSGAATLTGSTLNIPEYSSGGGSGAVTNITAAASPSGCTVSSGLCVVGSPASTISLTIPSGYNKLELDIDGAQSGTAGSTNDVVIQFNGDSSATHYFYAVNYSDNTSANPAQTYLSNGFGGAHVCALPGSTGGVDGSCTSTINNYLGTTFNKRINTLSGNTQTNTFTNSQAANSTVEWQSAVAITSMSITVSGGSNFVAGTSFALYGIQ
jgi:hypothetical protein